MDDQAYDLVLRDPDGGILMRWILNQYAQPCLGNGAILSAHDLVVEIAHSVGEDRRAREGAVT